MKIIEKFINYIFKNLDLEVGSLTINKKETLYADTIAEKTALTGVSFSHKISLPSGTSINELSIDGTLAGNSDDAVPTEKAVKTYVDGAQIDISPRYISWSGADSVEGGALYDSECNNAGENQITLQSGGGAYVAYTAPVSFNLFPGKTLTWTELTVYYSNTGSATLRIYIGEYSSSGTVTWKVQHDTDIVGGANHQIIDSSFTFDPDKWYQIYAFNGSGSGTITIYGWKAKFTIS